MTVEEFIRLIWHSHQHNRLYHFTDESNFDLIREWGLLSKKTMKAEGVRPKTTGGNEWSHRQDRKRGIDSYVCLCFTCNHPMKYVAHRDGRLPKPRYLAISPNVLKVPGVKIAFDVANKNGTNILPLSQALEFLDVEVIYRRTNWFDPQVQDRLRAAEKMEVLVPDRVARNLILEVR